LPLIFFQLGIAAYFISWAFLAGFIMMNIVLAILVDSFTEAQTELKREQATLPCDLFYPIKLYHTRKK
jgi:hypothetical protein